MFNVVDITDEQYETISKLIGKSFGLVIFSDIVENVT